MSPWDVLAAVGVPIGAPRPPPTAPFDAVAVRHALEAVLSQPLNEVEKAPLFAWLRAWEHHWPTSFSKVLGPLGPRALASTATTDPNRYLKLRRIAIENLSAQL